MILMPDLFSFAYVPNWYSQLDMLAEMALPEPWRFKNPIYLTKNPDTPILERYIHAIFKKQLIDYKDERNHSSAADYFHIENEFCCFHTGLYTRRYKAIYACFDRNKKKDSLLEWYFRGFADELSPMLRHISPLPKKPSYYMTQYGVNYNPEWPIRVNVDHILGDEENLSRIPAEIREAQNLPLLLETAVELARRKAVVEPSIVVPQGYQGRVQYLLPICLTDMEQPDLAMTLTIMDGYLAQSLGMDYFDECSYLPNQLMYWPSTPANGEFVYKETDGPWLDPDEILSAHPEWTDPTRLPASSRESRAKGIGDKKQADPLEKEGIVGVFNNAYFPINLAMEKFLSDIYELSADGTRYRFKESSSQPGVEIKEGGKFVYSHHAKDPAYLKLCSAFDIVRIHLFGDEDEKKSFRAMADFASRDETVKMLILEKKQQAAETDFCFTDGDDTWKKKLEYEPRSMVLKNNLHNITLIMENDPNLKGIVFNQLADGLEIKGEVPWKHPARFWRDADDAQLISFVDSHYGSFSERNYRIAVTKVTDDRSYHPIREMFESLPPWDKVRRAETVLIDYLGAEDNRYVRAVTRKSLCAAYMRVYYPGIKFDNMIVLNGAQGIGKSTLISALGGEWFSDSLALSDMNDKTAAEKLQGYWILEIGELAGMRKADIDKVKAFISRQDDKYRASFGRRVTPHPRQCVFFGTTNSENGYLRDITGNRRFWNVKVTVKNYDATKHMNICLPGMTSVNGSVGGENWCVYGDLDAYCDTASIMSYGMAWAGSAPGPVSPRSWLEGIYDYATQVMDPDKIFLGMPAYGWNWQIYDTPENLGETYRGVSNTYYAARYWMTGAYNFTGDAPPQPFLPIVAYWDDYDKVPYAFPHVYDYMEGADAVSREYPQLADTYNRRRYLTAYGKEQKTEFGTIFIDRDADGYSSASGIVSIENGIATLGDNGSVTYSFSVNAAGTYDVAVRLCYPFWDKNGIYAALDGSTKHFTESRLWWPYWRSTFWASLASGVTLSAGTHTITISLDVKGVQFYGFRVCSAFSEEPTAGEAAFALAPRSFKDVDGNMAVPDKGFKLTLEMLRRKPDSALIWYEDFQDYGVLETDYWTVRSGSFEVWRSDEYSMERVYSQLEGHGELAWQYDGFSELHLRARLAFPANGSGRAGVFCGSLFCCLNYDTQAVELYNGSTLLGSYSQEIARTSSADLRGNPTMYTVEMRVRGNRVRVYSGSSYTLRFTVTASGFSGGYAGYRSDNTTVCELLRLGDAWTYEPYERFDVEMPDGTQKSYGRISRSNCTWDEEFQVFTLTSDVEETSTRSEDISLDYDFFHSDLLEISCGGNYTAKVIPKDINIWISRLFLGDADGFSILYYQDVDSLVYWANQAAYRWKLRGMCMWSLGQEDMRLWEWLPKQTE